MFNNQFWIWLSKPIQIGITQSATVAWHIIERTSPNRPNTKFTSHEMWLRKCVPLTCLWQPSLWSLANAKKAEKMLWLYQSSHGHQQQKSIIKMSHGCWILAIKMVKEQYVKTPSTFSSLLLGMDPNSLDDQVLFYQLLLLLLILLIGGDPCGLLKRTTLKKLQISVDCHVVHPL